MLNVRVRKQLGAAGRGEGFTLDVDFEAPPGVTVLFGASGSGKTLTLKTVAGLVRPDSGRVSANGRVLYDSEGRVNLPPARRRVGYLFQNLALFPHMTALENVEFAAGGRARRERRELARRLLEGLGVAHAADRRPRAISGGEAQRVALARALAASPEVLLLDEPLSALDEPVKLRIVSDLKRLNEELRLPVLYVTHSRDEALMLGGRALIYERGRVAAEGAPEELFAAPASETVARLTGVENIFEGSVVARDEAAGTMTVELRGEGGGVCRVEVPLGRAASGARVRLAIRSGDILLAAEEPRRLSARNVLRGLVSSVEERSAHTLVRVRSQGVTWTASITRHALEGLGLEAGRDVWLAFKTYSCRVYE